MTIFHINSPEELADTIAAARRRADITQEELAEWAGVNRRYLTVLEAGPASKQVVRLMDVLHVLGYGIFIAPSEEIAALERRAPHTTDPDKSHT